MNVDAGIIISIVVAVASAAVSYGALRSSLVSLEKTLDEGLRELRSSRDKLGDRVGRLEQDAAAVKAVQEEISRPYRTKGGE